MKIRLATKEDCPRCKEIGETPELAIADGDYIPLDYYEACVGDLFFIAEEGGIIIGFALGEMMKGNVLYLGLMAVDSEFRSNG